MGRFITGIILTVLGAIDLAIVYLVLGYPLGLLTLEMVFGYSMIIGGVVLIYFGKRFVNRRRKVIEHALQILRESEAVNTSEIASRFGVDEIQVRKFLTYGLYKGILPQFDREGRSAREGELLTMEDISKMLESGLSENTVIDKIRTSSVIGLSIDDIIKWKDRGISETIIQESLKIGKAPRKRQPKTELGPIGLIKNNVGLYFLFIVTLGIYLFFWIHKVSKELMTHDPDGDNISPGRAVGFCFIPLFNFYWLGKIYYHTCNRINELYGGLVHSVKIVSSGGVLALYISLMIISQSASILTYLFLTFSIPLGILLMQIPLIMTQAALNRYWLQYKIQRG